MNTFLDPNVPYIKLFGLDHLLYVSIIITLFIIVMIKRKHLKDHAKMIRMILLILTIFQQILLYTWYTLETGFDLGQALPLHLCRISTLLSIIYFFTLIPPH